MPERSAPDPPYVAVAGGAADEVLVQAVLAGIEEESVPAAVSLATAPVGPAARTAAAAAPLHVGVAVVDGCVCVTHDQFPSDQVLALVDRATPAAARRLGHLAARVVLGVPLPPP